jgi:hypothetical protein
MPPAAAVLVEAAEVSVPVVSPPTVAVPEVAVPVSKAAVVVLAKRVVVN